MSDQLELEVEEVAGQCGCCELNSGPLAKQEELLTSEPLSSYRYKITGFYQLINMVIILP